MPRRVGVPDIGDPALEGCLLTEAQLRGFRPAALQVGLAALRR